MPVTDLGRTITTLCYNVDELCTEKGSGGRGQGTVSTRTFLNLMIGLTRIHNIQTSHAQVPAAPFQRTA